MRRLRDERFASYVSQALRSAEGGLVNKEIDKQSDMNQCCQPLIERRRRAIFVPLLLSCTWGVWEGVRGSVETRISNLDVVNQFR